MDVKYCIIHIYFSKSNFVCQGVDLSIDGDGSAFDTSRTGSEASRTSSTPRAVFKLEPYTPRTPINQISKVHTVILESTQYFPMGF